MKLAKLFSRLVCSTKHKLDAVLEMAQYVKLAISIHGPASHLYRTSALSFLAKILTIMTAKLTVYVFHALNFKE